MNYTDTLLDYSPAERAVQALQLNDISKALESGVQLLKADPRDLSQLKNSELPIYFIPDVCNGAVQLLSKRISICEAIHELHVYSARWCAALSRNPYKVLSNNRLRVHFSDAFNALSVSFFSLYKLYQQ